MSNSMSDSIYAAADTVGSVSASACHICGPNSVNPGQILLVYGTYFKQGKTKKNYFHGYKP